MLLVRVCPVTKRSSKDASKVVLMVTRFTRNIYFESPIEVHLYTIAALKSINIIWAESALHLCPKILAKSTLALDFYLSKSHICPQLLGRRKGRIVSRARRQEQKSMLRRWQEREHDLRVASLLRKRLVHQVRVRDYRLLYVDQFDRVLEEIFFVWIDFDLTIK